VNLDSVGDWEAAPPEWRIGVGCGNRVGTSAQRRRERLRNSFLERIAGEIFHLAFDGIETLPFALADFYREKLEKMPVSVGRAGASSFGVIEKTAGDVEANGPRSRRSARRSVCRPNPRRVYERGGVSGEPPGIPGGVFCVGAEESDRRFSHWETITLKSSDRSS
jgi:hypothetical protein